MLHFQKEVEYLSDSGSPGTVLVKLAERAQAQLIVIGTRGLGSLSRTILGSVSDYILHHADVPVCICSHNPPPEEPISDYWSELVEGLAEQSLESKEDQQDSYFAFLNES